MKQIPEEVKAGMALLDEKAPGWREKVDLDKLNMGGCVRCILGQIYGHFDEGLTALGICEVGVVEIQFDLAIEKAARYGFAIEDPYLKNYHLDYATFTQTWKEALSEPSSPVAAE
jgi:hypothetical protein